MSDGRHSEASSTPVSQRHAKATGRARLRAAGRATFALAPGLLVVAIVLGAAKDRRDRGDGAGTPRIAAGFERGPLLQSLGRDSLTIAWIASDPGTPAVDYGPTLDYGASRAADSDGDRRAVTLQGLVPGATCFYRIRAGERILAAGPEWRFTTDAGRNDSTFAFFVTGDVGRPEMHQTRTAASILRAQPWPDLGLLAGDAVYEKGRSEDYDRHLMFPWRDVFRAIPVWPALGNHDWKSDPAGNWEREWFLPGNEHYYSFDFGSAHFIALDTGDGRIAELPQQVRWLEADLQQHRAAAWTFVFFHHPGWTCTYKGDNAAVIEHFTPLFERYGVDVVFNGHAHTYERSFPMRQGEPVDTGEDPHYQDPGAPIYVVSGAGGSPKQDEPTRPCARTAFFRDEVLCWTHVVVDGARCTLRTVESDSDALVDSASIVKSRLERPAPGSR